MHTYYTAKTADGQDIPAQAKKLGTRAYGYATIKQALRYTPVGGYVEERHQTALDDWAGQIVAHKGPGKAANIGTDGLLGELED